MKKNILLYGIVLLFISINVIAQDGYVNTLSRWATHNLDGLNTFATGDPITAKGKLYQFGRNVPLAAEGSVLFWGNLGGPYADGSPANYRVWHIHLINAFSAGNWFGTGNINDTWESIVAQTVAGGAPPAGTFPGYDYTVAGYYGTNGGSPTPVGWHLPTYAEMKAIIPFIGLTINIDFSADYVQNNFQETSIDITGSGTTQSYFSDFQGKSSTEVVALRFKGSIHETAFRYEYITVSDQYALKISAKAAGGKTISEIVAWNEDNWNDAIVRYFPAAGYRVSANGNIQTPTEGYYWCGKVSESNVGYAYYYTFSNTRIRGSAYSRSNAYPIRCVQDYDPGIGTEIKDAKSAGISAWSYNGQLHITGASLEGKTVYIHNMLGATIDQKQAISNKVDFALPNGIYIVKVGNENLKISVK